MKKTKNKLINLINKTINLLRTKKILKKQIKLNAKFMKQGKYTYINEYTLVYKDDKTKKYVLELLKDKMHTSGPIIRKVIKSFFSKGNIKIKYNNYKKEYNASMIMITSEKKSLKMFDFDKGVVITKYFEKENYFKTIKNYTHFKLFFKTPKILKYDENKTLTIEKFIDYYSTSNLSQNKKEKLIKNIFERYICYLKANKEYVSIKDGVPYVKVMGDLMYKNILYKDNEFYYIDFDFSNNNFILYDIFTFIFYSYHNYNEKYFYQKYISGSYDNYINKMFEITNAQFNESEREKYFEYFIEKRITDEKINTNNDREIEIMKKYEELKM